MVALDSAGAILPTVPFTVITPELLRAFDSLSPIAQPPHFTDKDSYQEVTTPGAFVVRRLGRTEMIGIIGRQRVRASLIILPSVAPAPDSGLQR